MQLERKMFGQSRFIGCFGRAEPASYFDVYREEFGSDPTIKPVDKHAVDFLAEHVYYCWLLTHLIYCVLLRFICVYLLKETQVDQRSFVV